MVKMQLWRRGHLTVPTHTHLRGASNSWLGRLLDARVVAFMFCKKHQLGLLVYPKMIQLK